MVNNLTGREDEISRDLVKIFQLLQWRPDNWLNPYSNSNWDEGLQHDGFEEGASAMLKSLLEL